MAQYLDAAKDWLPDGMDQWACCKMNRGTTFNAIPLTSFKEMIPSQEEIKRITVGCTTGTKHDMFSLTAKKLYNYILYGCVTLPVLSHYFWGSTDNFLESAEPGNREGDRLLTMVLSDALSKTPVSVKPLTLWNTGTVPDCVTLQTCSDEVCIYHPSLCVNILLGSSPSISSGMTTFSSLCLPTGHIAPQILVTKALVMRCTQCDSQRYL